MRGLTLLREEQPGKFCVVMCLVFMTSGQSQCHLAGASHISHSSRCRTEVLHPVLAAQLSADGAGGARHSDQTEQVDTVSLRLYIPLTCPRRNASLAPVITFISEFLSSIVELLVYRGLNAPARDHSKYLEEFEPEHTEENVSLLDRALGWTEKQDKQGWCIFTV